MCVSRSCVDRNTYRLVVTGTTTTKALAVDDGYVYWADSTAGTISRVQKNGGTAAPSRLVS